jgi:hypothetical protein
MPDRDPVQGDREVGPPDTSEQQIDHWFILAAIVNHTPSSLQRVASATGFFPGGLSASDVSGCGWEAAIPHSPG